MTGVAQLRLVYKHDQAYVASMATGTMVCRSTARVETLSAQGSVFEIYAGCQVCEHDAAANVKR